MQGNQYNAESFKTFLQAWLVRQEHYLDELRSAEQNYCHESEDNIGYIEELISRTLSHYEDYYEKKSWIAQTNVFLVFSPTWFTPFEKTLLWIGGFRPRLICRLLNSTINDLSDEQSQRVTMLILETKMEERLLNNELAKIQERVAAPPLERIARRHGQHGQDRSSGDEILAITTMKTAFESILVSADLLRRNTALKMVEILTPKQTIKLLIAWTQLLLKIRASGLEDDARRRDSCPDHP